jgi:hypothetical protein
VCERKRNMNYPLMNFPHGHYEGQIFSWIEQSFNPNLKDLERVEHLGLGAQEIQPSNSWKIISEKIK